MEFKQVIKTCLDFSIAKGGTIQSYIAGGPDKLTIYSRTTRTEILLDRDPNTPGAACVCGARQISQLKNAKGKNEHMKQEIIRTQERLLECLTSFWDKPLDILLLS